MWGFLLTTRGGLGGYDPLMRSETLMFVASWLLASLGLALLAW